jgi:hypothetical protein
MFSPSSGSPLWLSCAYAGLLLLLGLVLCAWGCGALWFQGPGAPWLRIASMVLWCLAVVAAGLVGAWHARPGLTLLAWALGLAVLLAWWQQIRPSNTRVWASDVAQLLQAQPLPAGPHGGPMIRLDHVRNFAWRSDDDHDVRWESRSYDLARLRSVDLGVSYWMGPAIAHTLVSFGFDDGEQLVFSIEIRKERGEQFDALAGFFRRYELALVAADERDILAVRTNVRAEQLYLYRVAMPQEAMRELFLAYVEEAQALREAPRFYNTLTTNCTTLVWELARRVGAQLPLDWRLLASGYLPEYLYGLGVLAPGHELSRLRQLGDITERAQRWRPAPGDDERAMRHDFSRAIRQGIPAITP